MGQSCFYCGVDVPGDLEGLTRHYETHATRVGPDDGGPPMWTFACPSCGPSSFPWLKPAEVAQAMRVHVAERHPGT